MPWRGPSPPKLQDNHPFTGRGAASWCVPGLSPHSTHSKSCCPSSSPFIGFLVRLCKAPARLPAPSMRQLMPHAALTLPALSRLGPLPHQPSTTRAHSLSLLFYLTPWQEILPLTNHRFPYQRTHFLITATVCDEHRNRPQIHPSLVPLPSAPHRQPFARRG